MLKTISIFTIVMAVAFTSYAQGPEIVNTPSVQTPGTNGNGSLSANAEIDFSHLRSLSELNRIESEFASSFFSATIHFDPTYGSRDFGWFDIGHAIVVRDAAIADIQAYLNSLQYLFSVRDSIKPNELKPLQEKLRELNQKIKHYGQILPEKFLGKLNLAVFDFVLTSETKFTLSLAQNDRINVQVKLLQQIYIEQIPQENFGRIAYKRISLLTKLQFLGLLQDLVALHDLNADELSYILKDFVEGQNGFKPFADRLKLKLDFKDLSANVLLFFKSEIIAIVNLVNSSLALKLPNYDRPIVKPTERNENGAYQRSGSVDANDGIYSKKNLDPEIARRISVLRTIKRY